MFTRIISDSDRYVNYIYFNKLKFGMIRILFYVNFIKSTKIRRPWWNYCILIFDLKRIQPFCFLTICHLVQNVGRLKMTTIQVLLVFGTYDLLKWRVPIMTTCHTRCIFSSHDDLTKKKHLSNHIQKFYFIRAIAHNQKRCEQQEKAEYIHQIENGFVI